MGLQWNEATIDERVWSNNRWGKVIGLADNTVIVQFEDTKPDLVNCDNDNHRPHAVDDEGGLLLRPALYEPRMADLYQFNLG
ncbi:MAG: hypothetical protein HN842_09350 [Gammaproteobacteria bacterium]|jgi:hypothetical protein|nr:hypothetical protein [Gammaproteobacteria bacterium]